MSNYNDKNSDCANAELLISYLYDETSQAEKTAFETHLKDCAACSEELNGFNFARIAVQEWRVADLDSLPTPIFEIPAQTIVQSKSEKSVSWFDNLNQIFSFKPALAMSALIVLIALFGIAAFVFNFKTENDSIAENVKDKELTKTTVSPTVEKKGERKVEEINSKVESDETKSISAPEKIIEKNSLPVKSATTVKVSNQTTKNIPVKAVQNDTKKVTNKNIAPKSDVPPIVEADDEEDDSIRLTDLFDEIGTE